MFVLYNKSFRRLTKAVEALDQAIRARLAGPFEDSRLNGPFGQTKEFTLNLERIEHENKAMVENHEADMKSRNVELDFQTKTRPKMETQEAVRRSIEHLTRLRVTLKDCTSDETLKKVVDDQLIVFVKALAVI